MKKIVPTQLLHKGYTIWMSERSQWVYERRRPEPVLVKKGWSIFVENENSKTVFQDSDSDINSYDSLLKKGIAFIDNL